MNRISTFELIEDAKKTPLAAAIEEEKQQADDEQLLEQLREQRIESHLHSKID
jgi:hypothetical protein